MEQGRKREKNVAMSRKHLDWDQMDKSQPWGIEQKELQAGGEASTKLKGKQGWQSSENRKTSMDTEQWLRETGKGRHQRSGWSPPRQSTQLYQLPGNVIVLNPRLNSEALDYFFFNLLTRLALAAVFIMALYGE